MTAPDDRASLASRLIRNIDAGAREHPVREPLYDPYNAGLTGGHAARKLGTSVRRTAATR